MRKILSLVMVAAFCLFVAGMSFGEEKAKEDNPIKIGALFALSGPAAHIGSPTKLVAEMAADEINKKGGILGRKIKIVYLDTEGEPTKSVLMAKKLIENEKVSAIIGPVRTGEAMAIVQTVSDAGIPTIACVGSSIVAVPVKKWMFKSPQKTETAIEKIFEYLKKTNKTKIGIITATDSFGKDGKDTLSKMAEKADIKILIQEEFDPNDVDMTTQLTKIKGNSEIQALICWTIGGAGSVVAKNFKSLNFSIPLIQCHGLPDPKYIELAGAAAEGNIMPSTKLMVAEQLPDSDPQKKLLLDFIKEYTDVRKNGPVGTHSGYAWDAIQILAKAIEIAGSDEPTKIRDSVEKVKNYIGVSGIYNLSDTDHCGLDVDSMVLITIKDGKWKLLEY